VAALVLQGVGTRIVAETVCSVEVCAMLEQGIGYNETTVLDAPVEQWLAIGSGGVGASTMFQKCFCNGYIAMQGCGGEWGSGLSGDVGIGPILEQQSDHTKVARFAGILEGRFVVFITLVGEDAAKEKLL
jgi:hypothetical protein